MGKNGRVRFLAGLFLAALAVGCGGGKTIQVEVPVARAWPVDASARLYRDDAAVLPDSIRMVLKDPVAFAQAWAQATSALDQPPPAPQIDFTRHMVVYVGAGRSHPGDRIQVDSVGFRREVDPQSPSREIEVVYFVVRTVLEPDPFPGESFPIEIVRVERSEAPVRWEERRSGGDR
jgi:hypothetical protein